MEELIKLENLHPPPKPRLYKQVATKIETKILEEKMSLGGYKKYSDFLRDAIKKYNANGVEEKILQLTNMVTDISSKIIKIYNTILSGLTFNERTEIEKNSGILPNRKHDQTILTPEELEKKSSSFKVAMELKALVEEMGDIKKALEPAPEDEINKKRPKTDHLAFLEFKEKTKKKSKS